jgi:hypothetical protein
MKQMVCLLTLSAVLTCAGGCIPIGIRGSTIAAAGTAPCATRSHADASSRLTGTAAATDDDSGQAPPPRCT